MLIRLQEPEITDRTRTAPPTRSAAGIRDAYGGDDNRPDFHSAEGEWARDEIARWLLDTVS